MLSLLRLEHKQKNSSNPFRIRIFLFLSYSFRIAMIRTFIHSRSSLKSHTRFQTKMGKVYTRFQTKRAQKPYPMGNTYLYSYIREYPPGLNYASVVFTFPTVAFASALHAVFPGLRGQCISVTYPRRTAGLELRDPKRIGGEE